MSNGELVKDWWNAAAACPYEFPFGTIVTLPGGEKLICKDRFSKTYLSKMPNHPGYGLRVGYVLPGTNYFWLDMLSKDSPVRYGTPMQVHVQFP